jgi:hypothetical protein
MMRPVSRSEASRKQLYSSWLVWAKANLGRDSRLAAIAANAATEALEQGSEFSGASEAARSAWIGAAGGADPAPWAGPPPPAILVAMGIAIGGAAASSAFDLWFVRVGVLYGGLWAPLFVIFNVILVALNTWFLFGMWHRAEWAWRAAFTMVVIGAVFDFSGVVAPLYPFFDFGGVLYLVDFVAPRADWLPRAVLVWSWVHLVVIQAPILVLLWLTPSRQWVGIDSPAVRIHDQMRRS